MKRFLALFLSLACAFAYTPAYAAVNLDPNQCSSLAISATAASPTQIFAADSAAQKTYVINVSTNAIYIVGASTTSATVTNAAFSISTSTGSFYLPATAAAQPAIVFELDGPTGPYTGPLWGLAANIGGGTMTLLRCRTH